MAAPPLAPIALIGTNNKDSLERLRLQVKSKLKVLEERKVREEEVGKKRIRTVFYLFYCFILFLFFVFMILS